MKKFYILLLTIFLSAAAGIAAGFLLPFRFAFALGVLSTGLLMVYSFGLEARNSKTLPVVEMDAR